MLRRALSLSLILLCLSSAAPAADEAFLAKLNDEERAFIKSHPVIRVGADASWAPIDFVEEGKHSGISADYLALIAARLGIRFELVPGLTWKEALESAWKRELDVVSAITPSPERAEYLRFSAEFMQAPQAILTRNDAPFIAGLEALAGRRVAVVADHFIEKELNRNFPRIETVPVRDVRAGVDAVSEGMLFAFVGNLTVASHTIQRAGVANLKVASTTGMTHGLHIGVRKDWPILRDLMDKALADISPGERNAITRRWTAIRLDTETDYTVLLWIATAVLVVLGLLFWRNRRMARELRRHRSREQDTPQPSGADDGVPEGLSHAGSDDGHDDADLTGRRLANRYRVKEKLAFGGMAEVWLAWDERVERPVVLKVPFRHLLTEPSFRERFTREIRSLVDLKHANIVQVLDVGDLDGVPFLVMDHLDGGSLQDHLDHETTLPPESLSRWLPGIAAALDSVHGDGLIHRDVKPGNILFNRGGDAFLADFGLAKAFEQTADGLTKSGMYPGSPSFMPPDILTGDILPAYDQYALAAVVLVSVTGTTPEALRAHVDADERLGDTLPTEAKAAVLRGLSIRAEDRHDDCRSFAAAFRAGLETA